MKKFVRASLKKRFKSSLPKNDFSFEQDNLEKRETKDERVFLRKVYGDYSNPEVFLDLMTNAALKGGEIIAPVDLGTNVIVSVTGAAGQIAQSLLPRIAAGDMLGPNFKILLKLIELPHAMESLAKIKEELLSSKFPLLTNVVITDDLDHGFANADFCLLVGSKPRGKGMERGDVLKDNAQIFSTQGKSINRVAKANTKILVVGNPANTNALILSANAPNIPPRNITAMTKLDHDRGISQIAEKVGCKTTDIDRFIIWGNHSATQYPDLNHAVINGTWARDAIKDDDWIEKTFIPTVQKRGAQIIAARGKSSALSAASAAISHMREWVLGTAKWTSMAVYSQGLYGVPSGIWSSCPVICSSGEYKVVSGLEFDKEGAKRINASIFELLEEKAAVKNLLPESYNYPKSVFTWRHFEKSIQKKFLHHIFPHPQLISNIQRKLVPLLPTGEEFWTKLTPEFFKDAFQKIDVSDLDFLYHVKQDVFDYTELISVYGFERFSTKVQNYLFEFKENKYLYQDERYPTKISEIYQWVSSQPDDLGKIDGFETHKLLGTYLVKLVERLSGKQLEVDIVAK